MALTPVDTSFFGPSDEPPETFPNLPPVVITPADPLPRPYYIEDGLRRVRPYHYTYNTWCKQRWRGREILEIFASEFRDRTEGYYKGAIESGTVQLNGKTVPSVTTVVKNGDVISHTLHRHEPPVTAKPITVVHEDDDMMVINKPAGVPVHPAGRYNYNSVVEILRAERGYGWNPMPCNRLDRLTSGIMFMGKHKVAAEKMGRQIKGRTVRKEYVARVKGKFPEGEVVCEQPILQISPKLGLNRVRATGKEARTVFRRLAYYPSTSEKDAEGTPKQDSTTETNNSDPSTEGYSIVRCLPLTGRTHQIRVHLQYIGHPISNDPIYCNQKVFGLSLGAGDASSDADEDIITRLSRMGKDEVAEAVAYHDEMVDEYNKRKAEKMTGERCEVCGTELYSDPGAHELGIYLHALRYADMNGSWSYKTALPEWALPPTGAEGPDQLTKESDPLESTLAKMGIEDEAKDAGPSQGDVISDKASEAQLQAIAELEGTGPKASASAM